MKAYILSEKNGTVQIGRTVYCLPTGKAFQSSRRGLKGLPCYNVDNNSWSAAIHAAEQHKKKQILR